ncbi:MAG: sugar ABC transporter ATP-binding protein [Sinobacteraceae bacterium]|nr:sugar ABC transporter ATP-binding protein [Nevskiaceae bacterium]
MTTPLVEMQGITKAFGPVRVLEGVDFTLLPGEVHALMGENGAGKSTLIKILAGIHRPDAGSIRVDGQAVEIGSVADAERAGIAVIHQELNLIPELSVAENLFLGHEPARLGLLHRRAMRERARDWLTRVGLEALPVDTPVRRLSVGQQQLVEIARALGQHARVLVMDEPTTALTEHETTTLFALIRELRAQGAGIIYVSHRMEELFALCDRISVLRDGRLVGCRPVAGLSLDEVVRMMVGRPLKARFPQRERRPGAVRLKVEALGNRYVRDVGFEVRAGEVLGIAGLMGAGRTEILRLLFGLARAESGRIELDGRSLLPRSPVEAIGAGLALVPEDRKTQGLVLDLSVRENITLARVPARAGVIERRRERHLVSELIARLKIRTRDMEQAVRMLSGGNQQKVVLARWLALRPRVLLLDEPTRGVDVGGKAEIYELINALAGQGTAIVMVSSELPEVLAMSDRILVMHEGRATAWFDAADANQERIMLAATRGP